MNQLMTGNFISYKRKEKNLTQEQLAEKLGDLIKLFQNGKQVNVCPIILL